MMFHDNETSQSRDRSYIWRRGRDSNPRYPLRYVRFRGGTYSTCKRFYVNGLEF